MTNVKIFVRNSFEESVDLVLEPWGRVYRLEPGEPCTIVYDGDPQPGLSVDLTPGEIKIWAEGNGDLILVDPAA